MNRYVTRIQLKMLAAVSIAAADLHQPVAYGVKRTVRWKQIKEAMSEWFDMDITDQSAHAHIKALERKGFIRVEKVTHGRRNDNLYSVVNGKHLQPIVDELHDVHMILKRHLP